MTNRNRNEERRRNGECECHRDAMGHHFGENMTSERGRPLRWGEVARCGVTFAAHQLDPQPCALAQYGSSEPDANAA